MLSCFEAVFSEATFFPCAEIFFSFWKSSACFDPCEKYSEARSSQHGREGQTERGTFLPKEGGGGGVLFGLTCVINRNFSIKK